LFCLKRSKYKEFARYDTGKFGARGGSQSCRVAPRRVLLCFKFEWFGHLVGPIMGTVFRSVSVNSPRKNVGNHVFSFQQNKGSFQHRRGLFQQGLTKEAFFLHEPTRCKHKIRTKVYFLPHNRPVFATSTLFTLTQRDKAPLAGPIETLPQNSRRRISLAFA
jgi:hypothetical protein